MFNIDTRPFPEIVTDEFFKYTKKKVVGFEGLQIRNGPYGALSSVGVSDGVVDFCCHKEMETSEFLKVVDWVANNGEQLLNMALESFVEFYWEMRDVVIPTLVNENPDDIVPKISDYSDLARLCGIVAVHVSEFKNNGEHLFGIEFGCNWEDEHGAGCRFEGLKLIESGDGSDSFSY